MHPLLNSMLRVRVNRTLSLSLLSVMLTWSSSVIACSCGEYYFERPEPDWVGSQTADGVSYIAAGSSECTGLKSIDEGRADNDARSSLTKMLNTVVSTSEKTSVGAIGNVGYSRYKADTNLESQQILQNATIFDRWIDGKNCVVYAGISLQQADLEKGKANQLKAQQEQLIAQNACIESSGDNKGQIKEMLIERLSQQGFTYNTAKACQVKYQLANKIVRASKDMLESKLVVKMSKSNQPIWHKTYSGKAMSYSQKSRIELIQLAISDSLDNFFVDLSSLKHKKITQ